MVETPPEKRKAVAANGDAADTALLDGVTLSDGTVSGAAPKRGCCDCAPPAGDNWRQRLKALVTSEKF
eukprot:5010073-Prymnesium_polylepis.1